MSNNVVLLIKMKISTFESGLISMDGIKKVFNKIDLNVHIDFFFLRRRAIKKSRNVNACVFEFILTSVP